MTAYHITLNSMQKFNKGDRVRLREGSGYYGGIGQLPIGEVGTIVDIRFDTYSVEWFGGSEQNTYQVGDLQKELQLIHPTITPNK